MTPEVQETRVTSTGDPMMEQPTTDLRGMPVVRESRVTRYRQGYRPISLIWLLVGFVNVVLFFDFIFRAFRANDVGFADSIYSVGGVLAAPFDGIFNQTINNSIIGVARWADILAIVVYTLIGYALVKVVDMAYAPPEH